MYEGLQGPDVGFGAILRDAQEDLWGNELEGTTQSFQLLPRPESGTQAKVNNFHLSVLIYYDIVRLQVSMRDTFIMALSS